MAENQGSTENSNSTDGPRGLDNHMAIWVIALLILSSVILMIAAAMFNLDRGRVLAQMSRIEFARGLITYLFAIVTIGTAVLLIVSALITSADDPGDKRFQRGKEILSLLLGVFGTVVGFYFGSEVSKGGGNELSLAPLRLARSGAPPNSQIALTTFVSGGRAPYEYRLIFGNEQPGNFEPVPESGWINKDIKPPAGPVQLVVEVRDSEVRTSRQVAFLVGQP